jgi:hypothetical protein
MSRTSAQALLDELQRYVASVTLSDKPEPLERFSGAVAGGPTLLVENLSDAHHSVGIEVRVAQEDAQVRNFALSATADQQAGIGVIGRGDFGVYGFSNDPQGCGVEGHTASPTGIGVLASTPAPEITALAIGTGNIRVLGAGQNTPTPVFIHVASERNTRGGYTILDHPMTNGDPNAILIVTRRIVASGDPAQRASAGLEMDGGGLGVGYSQRAEKWMIGQHSGKPIAANAEFNVLVFKA